MDNIAQNIQEEGEDQNPIWCWHCVWQTSKQYQNTHVKSDKWNFYWKFVNKPNIVF